MHVVKQYPEGIVCWVDLMTTDAEAAKVFYTGVFGWEIEDRPTGMGGVYTMLMIEGKSVAGLGDMGPEQQAQGMPPVWTSYIKSSDVDAMAVRVSEAGGRMLMPPMDVLEEGRMAMAQDPTGAVFGIWQPRNHIGAQLVNMPNTLVWNELQTRDAETARAFYEHVFTWSTDQDASGYYVFAADGRRHAGMIRMDESWGPHIPSNWAVYFMVADLTETLAKVAALGGRVLVPAMPAGEMGQFAVVQDPQGGIFTVMELKPGYVDPPPGA